MGRISSLLILVLLISPLVRAQSADYDTDADEEGVLNPVEVAPAPAPRSRPARAVIEASSENSYCTQGPADIQEICLRINSIRAQYSRVPLRLDPTLNAVAVDYAQRLYEYNNGTGFALSHSLNGWSLDHRLQHFRVSTNRLRGENIAAGQRSPAEVVQGWMDSPGHRENILLGGFQHSGIGHYGHFWVQVFLD